jgi:hypothetical protein
MTARKPGPFKSFNTIRLYSSSLFCVHSCTYSQVLRPHANTVANLKYLVANATLFDFLFHRFVMRRVHFTIYIQYFCLEVAW